MFNVSALLLDDALKTATPLTNGANFLDHSSYPVLQHDIYCIVTLWTNKTETGMLVGCSCFRSFMTSWWSHWLMPEIATRRWNKLTSSRFDCVNIFHLHPTAHCCHAFGTIILETQSVECFVTILHPSMIHLSSTCRSVCYEISVLFLYFFYLISFISWN